jgi:hypothetical protein
LINLSLPADDEVYYVNVSGALLGPLRLNGTPSGNKLSVRTDIESLAQGQKRHYENNVDHVKSEGEFSYHPVLRDLTSLPNLNEPGKASWKAIKASNGSSATVTLPFGLMSSGKTLYYPDSLTTLHYNRLWIGDPYKFTEYVVKASPTASRARVIVIKYIWTFKSATLNQIVYSRTTWGEITTTIPASGYGRPLNSGEIQNLVNQYIPGQLTSGTDDWGGVTYRTYSSPSLSVSSFKKKIDSLSRTMLDDLNSPLAEIHYGDLAMEASKKVNANQVNMVAFLRDLRNPKDMIPKLRNLAKLKDYASSYLATKYGLLPTIDDIKSIVEAFQRAKPYIDRNGLRTYNAVSSQNKQVGSITYELIQRIKIAIENEDSEFAALAQKIESMGFALTLQNVWDLIPYSFVIDWFVNVGDLLERSDARMRLMRLNVRYSTMSRKDIRSVQVNPTIDSPISGTLRVVRYQRWTEDHCPEPPLILASTPNPASHWLEGGALIVQRTK